MQEGHYWDPAGTDANHGKHTTPTFIDNDTDPAAPTGTNEVKLYNKGGVLQTIKQGGTSVPVGIPSGTKMLFKQSTAPTGWTFVAEDNDRVLINTSTQSEGGGTGGSWTISGISVQGHTLTEAELPSITGSFDINKLQGGGSIVRVPTGKFSIGSAGEGYGEEIEGGGGGQIWDRVTYSFGGGQSHGHGISIGDDWRPLYVKVITCRKD
jgi:hypothetical protein